MPESQALVLLFRRPMYQPRRDLVYLPAKGVFGYWNLFEQEAKR